MTKQFIFDNYVCDGDTSTVERNGYVITATIRHDSTTRPHDYDEAYTKEVIAAWERDEWFFCGVVLSATYNGVPVHDHAASLWGLEANFGFDNSHIAQVADELLDVALEEAENARQTMIAQLSEPAPEDVAVTWTTYDQNAAREAGWQLVQTESGAWEIRRYVGDTVVYGTDAAAAADVADHNTSAPEDVEDKAMAFVTKGGIFD